MATTIEIPDDIAEGLRLFAAEKGQDVNHYAAVALREVVARERGRREGLRLLEGPGHVFDADAALRKAGLPTGRTGEEIAASYDAALTALTPEQRRNAEELGLI